ncbi:uncharacterized protein [Penaeus vannamei]|uniref:uncharacterized protein isoform X1 n=1 Tax=Penaeus vannamei TaxID=6689 RepID=UPI00387F8314
MAFSKKKELLSTRRLAVLNLLVKEATLTAAERLGDPPKVNVAIINKLHIRVTWKREGPWSTARDFTVDFRGTGTRPTSKYCTGLIIPCTSDVCSFDSNERCPSFGVCREVGVVIKGNGYSSPERRVRTDAYTPASVSVESNGGLLNVSWQGPANKDGDCYTGSVLTISTPWTEYSASFTEILDQYQHSHNLTGCDVGNVTASLRSFDLVGNSATVTNSTEYLGESAFPVISELSVTPGRRSAFVSWDLLENCTEATYLLAWAPPDGGGEMRVSSTYANITGLSPYEEYLLTVQPLKGTDNLGTPRSVVFFTEYEGLPEVNITIANKLHIRVTWKREGPWGAVRDFIVDFRSIGDRPTSHPCTGQIIPCSSDVCSFYSHERCPGFGVCRDVGVVIKGNGYSTDELQVRTDAYTPASVSVESNGGLLNVSWQGPANKDGDCYTGSVLTISTPWTEYSASFTEILNQYQHSHNLTGCDVGNVTASLRSFDLVGNSATVTDSTEYLGENASPVIDDLKVTPERTSVFVTWDLLGNCARVTSYLLTWTPPDAGGEITGSSSFANITGLSPCQEYFVTVQPLKGTEGLGAPRSEKILTGYEVPQAPTNVTVLAMERRSDSLHVTWTQPPPPGPLCPITKNTISWSRADTGGSAGEEEIAASSSYTIIDLDPCAQYSVLVKTANEEGYGDQYGEKAGNTYAKPPQAPSNIRVLMVEDVSDHLNVTWTQPAAPGPLCPITNNSIRWFLAETGDAVGQEEIITSAAYSITGLEAYTTYMVHVASKTDGGFGQEGTANNTTDQDIPGPAIITSLDIVTPSSLLVKWLPPPRPNGVITKYKIKWRYGNQVDSTDLNYNETHYRITNLTACVSHEIIVMAKTIKGFGDTSAGNTTMAVAPEAPDDVVAAMVPNISDQLQVTWTPPKPHGKCTITSIKVTWIWQSMGESQQNETDVSSTSNYTISGLKPYTNYTVCVAVQTEGGYGPTGHCSSAVTEEDVPGPPVVTDIEPSPDSIHLLWEHPVEPRGELLFYNLSWMNVADTSDGGKEKLPANQTSYTITGLRSKSQYNISLMAKTSAGWGTVMAETHETSDVPTINELLWTVVVIVLALPVMMGLLVIYRQRRDSGFLPNINDIPNGSKSIYKEKFVFQNESYIYDGQDVEEMTENEYYSFDEQDPEEGAENNEYISPELSASPNSSPDSAFNENEKEIVDGETNHTTEFSSDEKILEDLPPSENTAERAENSSVPVNLKAESTDGHPEEKTGKSVSTRSGSLVQDVIEKTENRESVLDLRNMGDIHEAARRGLAGDVLRSLEDGGDPSASTSSNYTPLHFAAFEGHTDVARLLLDRKSDPNQTNDSGDTPLHLAAINGKIEVVKMFSEEKGVSLHHPSAMSQTLLAYARHGREQPMLDVLRNPETVSPDGNTPLHCASLAGHTEVVELLLMKKADVKSETPTHHTPLHYAALTGDAVLVKLLVLHGADPNATDERNNTPLHYAALCGHTSVVELLLEERADINIRTDMGLSVLHKASFYGRLSTVQKLVELEETLVNALDKENLSAEDTALIRGHVHTAWWLNKNTHQASLQDQKPLTNICMSRYKQSGDFYHAYCREKNASAEALATAVDFGVCDMHYQDERGRTLLHVAAEQGDRPKIGVLMERGALPTARTHDGKTPSDLAREKGHLEAAKAIADEVKVEEMGLKKKMLYTHLLNLITATAKANLQGDNEEQAARLTAVKEASSLLASGAPLEPPGGHSCYPLHHAITTNCTSLLPLLLAAGAPLTSSADRFGPVQMAWMTPDATPWVGVVVTRAMIHKIQMEMKFLDPELQISAETLVKSLEGDKPWDAKINVIGDSSSTLDSLSFRACASGATTVAWWIWHSGGSAVSQNKNEETPLHAALDAGHLGTASALVLHMGANLFLPDKNGRAPIDLLPDGATREQLLKASLTRECRRLADESEKAREPIKKEEAKKFVALLLSLYCAYDSERDADTDHDLRCWKTVFGCLNDELSEGDDDWMAKLFRVFRKLNTRECEDKGSASSFSDDTYSDWMDQVVEKPFEYIVASVPLSNSENDIQMNTLTKILEKATILSCEREFPLFLHLLVQVGGQKVDQELEVCRASPLHYAALKNNVSAARYLVSHGASVEAKDRFGNTPAHYACMYGHKDLGEFLRTYKVNTYGLTAMDILGGYVNYLKLYELDLKSLENIDMQKTNTGPQRIKYLLKELKKKWQSNGIGKTVSKVHVNYSRGESQDIEKAVFNFVDSLKNLVAKKNPMFNGKVVMLGSSADNVRLFCPDEFDCNIVLSSFNGGLQVSLEEMGPNYSGCKTKINVSSKDKNIISLLKGTRFLHTFYDLVKGCISNIDPEDERMTIIPPGVKRTKVGVGLSLAWTGKEFPLLLVDVDIVPTMEAPWPPDLPRPPLTPPYLKSVYINSIGNGEWRFSFAKAENEIMKNLTPDQRLVFLACKMVLSSLKVEKWASRDIQNRFKYFDKIFFKISSPKSFILKNTFFLELQEFKDQRNYWTDHLEKRIRSIFERMCEKDIKEPVKIEAYFAGGTEAPSIGYGASEIVSFFTPKPGFHGVSEY